MLFIPLIVVLVSEAALRNPSVSIIFRARGSKKLLKHILLALYLMISPPVFPNLPEVDLKVAWACPTMPLMTVCCR